MDNCWSSTSRVPKQGAQKNSDTWPSVTAGVHEKTPRWVYENNILSSNVEKGITIKTALLRTWSWNSGIKLDEMAIDDTKMGYWNNNSGMAYSSKCERTVFEIQTMEIPTLPPPPTPPKRASLKKIRITGTEENIFDDKLSIMKDK